MEKWSSIVIDALDERDGLFVFSMRSINAEEEEEEKNAADMDFCLQRIGSDVDDMDN